MSPFSQHEETAILAMPIDLGVTRLIISKLLGQMAKVVLRGQDVKAHPRLFES